MRTGRGIVVTLLLVAGCGNGGSSASNAGGGAGGNAGAAGGVGGSAGGEPAAGGASGAGGGGAGAGGTGTAGGGDAAGVAGTYGGGTSGAGGGDAGAWSDGGGVGGAGWLTPPPIPPALVAPAGATVALHAHAVGAQIYTCTASGGADAGADAGATSYAWVLKAPDAKLYDEAGAQLGTHGAGPSWTANDGSVAHGTKVAELPPPLPGAITWLLLRVSSTTGAGTFSDVTYVQRLSTAGGTAPATGCDATTVGTDTRAGYSADYYFYKGGAGAAWLEAPTNVPDAIKVPMGLKLKLHDHGLGVQIYNCAASGGADAGADAGAVTYAWTFRAPDATLYDETFTPVGSHSAGPTWTSADGSAMTARELARADAPRADAVPWLLLKEFTQSGPGVFGDVAIVQRLNTAGGQPPATGCDATTVNTLTRVPYSADYYFFVSTDTGDGGAGN